MLIFLYSLYFHFMKCVFSILVSVCQILVVVLFFYLVRKKRESIGHKVGKTWGKIVLFLSFIKVKKDIAPLPDSDANYFFAPNHQSSFDIYLCYAFLPKSFIWVAKKSLFIIPLFGWAMWMMGHISVERDNSQKGAASLRKIIQKIKNGISIAIFPEGTRSVDGKLLPFKKGVFGLARLSGLPIVPVLIKNSGRVAKKYKFRVDPRIVIEFKTFDPINSKDKEAESKLRLILEKEL